MFRTTAPATAVINRVLNFGQVINREGKITDFGHKEAQDIHRVWVLGNSLYTPTKCFLLYPQGSFNNPVIEL